MESLRLHFQNQADYQNFTAWMVSKNANFSTRHFYSPSAVNRAYYASTGDRDYYASISFEDADTDPRVPLINEFIETQATESVKMEHRFYESPESAIADPFVDTEVLLDAVGKVLSEAKQNLEQKEAKAERLSQSLEKMTEDKKFYSDRYFEAVHEAGRVKEQISAIAVLINAIFPKG